MTTEEKLDRIKAICEELIESKHPWHVTVSTAGWRATLAAINALPEMDEGSYIVLSDNIIFAWEGLL